MTDETPTADWPTFFQHLPITIQQLRAHGHTDAANLLCGVQGVLLSVDATYEYEELVHCLGHVARIALGRDNTTDAASVDALNFFERVVEAFDLFIEARQDAFVEMLEAA